MQRVTLDGKTYEKASVLARELGYTKDYVGQLCRAGKVDAHLVGRSWYVDPSSLKKHKSNRYRSTKAKSQKALQEQVRNKESTDRHDDQSESHFYAYNKTSLRYDTDETELIPNVQKQKKVGTDYALPVALADAEEVKVSEGDTQDYHFKPPKRETIQFHGTLKVSEYMGNLNPENVDIEEGEGPEVDESKVVDEEKKSEQKPNQEQVQKIVVNQKAKKSKKKSHTQRPQKHTDSNSNGVVGMHRNEHEKQPLITQTEKTQSHTTVTDTYVEDVEQSGGHSFYIVASATLAGLVIAISMVSIEAHVQASASDTYTNYSFVIHRLFALLTLWK